MCLILLAYRVRADYPLVLAANRDEFFGRPTSPAGFWKDAPEVLAGRDLRAGGTWMGVTRAGRWAAVTNYRDLPSERGDARSRGHMVSAFLTGDEPPASYIRAVSAVGDEYNGFNLLVGDASEAWYASNRGAAPRPLAPGVYGLSNHLLDTPWRKVVRGKQRMAEALAVAGGLEPGPLLDILAETDPAPEAELPDTGIGIDLERALSSLFIVTPDYGTRASTVLLLDADGAGSFTERSHRAGAGAEGEVHLTFPPGSR
jgi:uncharacterized protein with NRDE domain